MTAPQFFGGDDRILYLKRLAEFSRSHPDFGPPLERSLELFIEETLKAEASQELTSRDLHRDLESAEADLKKVRGY
jgi:hypothetical protein